MDGPLVFKEGVAGRCPFNLEHFAERVNAITETTENPSREQLLEIFLDAVKVLKWGRVETTISMIQKELKQQLSFYHYEIRLATQNKRRLQNRIGQNGKPLKESTLKSYQRNFALYMKSAKTRKIKIQKFATEIKKARGGRTFSFGNVKLQLIRGGQYAARLSVDYINFPYWTSVR